MKSLIGYVWKIRNAVGDATEIICEDDMLLVTVKPYGKEREKYRYEVTSPYGSGKIEATLGKCKNWVIKETDYDNKIRYLLCGDVVLTDHTHKQSNLAKRRNKKTADKTHRHHIVMVYPDPLPNRIFSGYVLAEENAGKDPDEVLEAIKKKYGETDEKSSLQRKKALLHNGTYHSEG